MIFLHFIKVFLYFYKLIVHSYLVSSSVITPKYLTFTTYFVFKLKPYTELVGLVFSIIIDFCYFLGRITFNVYFSFSFYFSGLIPKDEPLPSEKSISSPSKSELSYLHKFIPTRGNISGVLVLKLNAPLGLNEVGMVY
jgi:hypothetical protein